MTSKLLWNKEESDDLCTIENRKSEIDFAEQMCALRISYE